MQTAFHPITIRKGQTDDVTWTLEIDGEPVDLTGYSAVMDVRDGRDETDTLILRITSETPDPDADYPVAEFIIDDVAGTIQRLIDADISAVIPTGAYHYDLKLSAGGVVDYLTYGPFIVTRRVTP